MFSYKELRKATESFSRSELLGSGGFGAVYRGSLPSGALVAVKRMRHEGKHGEESCTPHTGKATKESDVSSFGVLVLEVMCGTRPLDGPAIERGQGVLVDRVWRAHEAGRVLDVIDLRLGTFPPVDANWRSDVGFELHERENVSITKGDVELLAFDTATADKKLVTNLLRLGLLCCNPNPEDRSSTRLVSQLLRSLENMDLSLPPLPICKPHAYYNIPGFSRLAIVPSSTSSSSLSTTQSLP